MSSRYHLRGVNGDPLGPLGFDFTQHRQTLHPTVDGTRSKALRPFRIAVKDLEDPAVQCRWLAASG